MAGLIEVQRLAVAGGQGGLTAVYYALTYVGFAAPFVLAEAAHLTSYTVLLAFTAVLALGSAGLVTRRSGDAALA